MPGDGHAEERISALLETRHSAANVEATGCEPLRHRGPGGRHRDGPARAGSHGERSRDQVAAAVLEEVDVHLVAASRHGPRHAGELREIAHGRPREGLGQGTRAVVAESRAKREQHVQAVLSESLHEVCGAELRQQAVEVARDRHHRLERRPLRVEVEDQPFAWREGRITCSQAHTLVPLVLAPGSEPFHVAWIEHAAEGTVRRLEHDAEQAFATGALDPLPLPEPS